MSPPPVRRRTLAQATVWAIPSVLVASAAPAFAASGACPADTSLTFEGSSPYALAQASWADWDLTNTGPDPWPAGTTITWTVTRVGSPSQSAYLGLQFRPMLPDPTAGTPSLLSPNLQAFGTAVFIMELVSEVPANGQVRWTAVPTLESTYASRVEVAVPGCTPVSACGSAQFARRLVFARQCPLG